MVTIAPHLAETYDDSFISACTESWTVHLKEKRYLRNWETSLREDISRLTFQHYHLYSFINETFMLWLARNHCRGKVPALCDWLIHIYRKNVNMRSTNARVDCLKSTWFPFKATKKTSMSGVLDPRRCHFQIVTRQTSCPSSVSVSS